MIEAVNLGKRYTLYKRPVHRLIDALGLKRMRREFWALRNVYLSIPRGACFGIIGRNGAGKSTLLKLISGITRPTEGSVSVNGTVASILELGAGFHHGFTGRDNVFLNCALYGYSRAETQRLMDDIVEFSELGEFIHQPVRTYSTGMVSRLAFAVASTVDPDVLIVDEALAVGDEQFRSKCLRRIHDFKAEGKTIVLVSHDLGTVRHLCSHAALLDEGSLAASGSPESILDRYLELAHKDKIRSAETGESSAPQMRWGEGDVCVETIELRARGESVQVVDTYQDIELKLAYEVKRPLSNVIFGCQFYRSDGTYINGSNHYWHDDPLIFDFERAGERGCVICQTPRLSLLPGDYYVTVCCYSLQNGVMQAIDHWERAFEFTVSERLSHQHGLTAFETQWTLERDGAA